MSFLILLIGLVMLVAGAELLVRGGGNLAIALRIPALVVGLTIVAAGTSAPELMVSVIAALQASTDVAISNVNGSNIANILFVLGVAAMIRPLMVNRSLLRRDIPVVIGFQVVVLLLAFDGVLSQIDGVIFVALGVAYDGWLLYSVLKGGDTDADVEEFEISDGPLYKHAAFVVVGLVVLVVGANLFVEGAVAIAKTFGLSDRFIGLTVIALGTSAPEAATAMAASRNNESEMAVGNSVGSNILNIAMVLGITAIICPIAIQGGALFSDMGVALGAAVLLVPLVMKGVINRVDGAIMVVAYLVYLAMQYYWGA